MEGTCRLTLQPNIWARHKSAVAQNTCCNGPADEMLLTCFCFAFHIPFFFFFFSFFHWRERKRNSTLSGYVAVHWFGCFLCSSCNIFCKTIVFLLHQYMCFNCKLKDYIAIPFACVCAGDNHVGGMWGGWGSFLDQSAECADGGQSSVSQHHQGGRQKRGGQQISG